MPAAPAAAVLGGRLSRSDPLSGEWDVIVVGPQFAAALVSRDLGDDGPDGDRRFDAVVTHDRDLVVRAALSLLPRLLPADRSAGRG
jgi:DICT domain-containing protein